MIIYDYNKPVPENLQLHQSEDFKYIDSYNNPHLPPVVFLHGLMGNTDCWYDAASAVVISGFRAIIPFIPIQDMPLGDTNVSGIVKFISSFLDHLNLDQIILVGNSLGGQIAVRYASQNLDSVIGLLLSGSSGIYEMELGKTTFRRSDRDFIRLKAEMTFYDPKMVNDDLVDRICEISTNRSQALRFLRASRSSMTDLIVGELQNLDMPAFLIWGLEDQITPIDVGYEFQKLLPNAELHLIKNCGHAPMMEHPEIFNKLMVNYLNCTFKDSPALVEA